MGNIIRKWEIKKARYEKKISGAKLPIFTNISNGPSSPFSELIGRGFDLLEQELTLARTTPCIY